MEDMQKSSRKSRRKLYIPIRIQTNAANKDDIPINTCYVSVEDVTSECSRSLKTNDVEIRYLDSIRRISNKLKSSYLCSQAQCPVFKECLGHHQLEYHNQNQTARPTQPRANGNPTKWEAFDSADSTGGTVHRLTIAEPCIQRSVAISPKASILKRTIDTRARGNQYIQTLKKYKETNHTVQDYAFESDVQPTKMDTSSQYDAEFKPCNNGNKISFTTNNCLMKDDLEDIVNKWCKDIPIYANLPPSGKKEKRNLINEFIEKMFILTNEKTTGANYEGKVKIEIDNFLNSLPIWYPDGKRDDDTLKNGLCKKLLDKLITLRGKLYVDDAVNTDLSLKLLPIDNFNHDNIIRLIESEIIDWLMQIKFNESEEIGRTVNILDTAYTFTRCLMPLLHTRVSKNNYKLLAKGLILDTLNDLPNVFQYPENKVEYIQQITEELTNRLVYILVKSSDSDSCCRFHRSKTMYPLTVHSETNLRTLDEQNICSDYLKIIEDIKNIIADCIEAVFSEDVMNKYETADVISTTLDTPGEQILVATSGTFINNVKESLTEDIMREAKYTHAVNEPCFSKTLAVFTSEHDLFASGYPITSTPKRIPEKRENKQYSVEETEYTKKVSNLIRSWMDTLPKSFNEDKNFKDTIIADLAGDIVDETKLEQLVLNSLDRDQVMSYIIFRWLYRYNVFGDLSEDIPPQVGELIKHLNEIVVPDLTKPRFGNRQDLAKLKTKESDRDFFVPKGMDVLEDEISIWMNEQPTEIYAEDNESKRIVNIHELAATLQKYLFEKKSEKEITNQISKWLKKVLKSLDKEKREKLAASLKERIIAVPQDYTLREKLHKKIQGKLHDEAAKLNSYKSNVTNIKTRADNLDNTLKEFVIKFIEHNYDVEDTVAREAFGELLKREFRKLSPPTRKEVYDNFTKRNTKKDFSIERLEKELKYIKIVSDWLRNIPLQSSFITPHNAERIEFVNNLAQNIYEVEEERRFSPTAMDYNMYLSAIISEFTNQLPIFYEYKQNLTLITDELMKKIVASRIYMPCCQDSRRISFEQRTTDIQEQDINKFIDQYIYQHLREFVDDSMETDARFHRVLKEIKRMAHTTAEPLTLSKAQVYNILIETSLPEENLVNIFSRQLDYARQISEWMKNLPLLRSLHADEIRMKLICELAEILSDRDKNQLTTTSSKSDVELEKYVNQWIDRIPVDSMKSIVKPVLVQQLLKRIERTKWKTNRSSHENINVQDTLDFQSSNAFKSNRNRKINKARPKSSKCNSMGCSYSKIKNSGQLVVEAIEDWSKNIPFQSDDKEVETNIKQEIETKLYQIVGKLSVDPQVMNDNHLFEKLFSDEISAQLNNLSHIGDIIKKKDTIKEILLDKVMNARSIAQENAVGDNYKYQLKNTIAASIPNPISNKQLYDPGFEIYKSRLADKFILDNFDHSDDSIKMKYEKNIESELEKYFLNVQKRNVNPVTQNEIYNELYSALFKVPIPKKGYLMDKVEEVKTRCEIDTWYKMLPIQEPRDLTEVLERHKILTTIAKRLHQIETTEKDPEEKMFKEIKKWLAKFPLLPGEQHNITKYADDLLNILKQSKEDRKCVALSIRKENKKNTRRTKSLEPPNSKSVWAKSAANESQTCCQITPTSRKNLAEMILEIVEAWCEQLPLPSKTPSDYENNKIIRDNLLTGVIMKICELNNNPLTFNDEILYDYYLDAELDNLLSNLPISCDFANTKHMKKLQLKAAIKTVMPLVKEDKASYDYREALKTTIDAVLPEPFNTTAENIAMFNQLRDEIVDNFIQLHYNEDNDEGKQVYKAKLHEVLLKYFQDIRDSAEEPPVDPLIRQNQLLCELAKVPIPTESVLRDEVEEIKIKHEVEQFFADLNLPENKLAHNNDVKLSLAKQLYEIERKGHNCDNDAKMRNCIKRCLEKLNLNVNSNQIDDFVYKLKVNEASRKARPNNLTIRGNCKPVGLDLDVQIRSTPKGAVHSNIMTVPIKYQGFEGNIPASSSIIQRRNVQEFNRQDPSFPNTSGTRYTDQFASDLRYKAVQDATTAAQTVFLPKDPDHVRTRRLTTANKTENQICTCGRRFRKLRKRPRRVLQMEDLEHDHFVPPMWMPYRGPVPCFYF